MNFMGLRGDRLRQSRERKGLSQSDLAAFANISARQIGRYENGDGDVSGESILRIAQALEVSTDYLFGLSDDPRGHFGDNSLNADEKSLIDTFRQGGWVGVSRLLMGKLSDHIEDKANKRGES